MTAQPPAEQRVEHALDALGMAGDRPRIAPMLRFLQELQHWNRAYNLTAVRDTEQMLVQHVFDSLSIMPFLRGCALRSDAHLVDVGSGAGLPGLIIGLCEPGWAITCIDAVEKKTAFIRQAAGILGLHNVGVRHARVETLASLQADVVVSRAFASLANFVRAAHHHCAPHGFMLAMKGQFPDIERQELEANTAWCVHRHVELQVPELPARRCLLQLAPKDSHD